MSRHKLRPLATTESASLHAPRAGAYRDSRVIAKIALGVGQTDPVNREDGCRDTRRLDGGTNAFSLHIFREAPRWTWRDVHSSDDVVH